MNNYREAFLELVRAGLWEKEARLSPFGRVDYEEVMRFAEEQSVVGLVTAGMEQIADEKIPQADLLQFIYASLQIEQRNLEMNSFIAEAVEKMCKVGIYGLLVKGSGLAQCYSRPMWRTCGDIDFFFSNNDYDKAVSFFLKQDGAVEVQNARYTKSFGVVIEPWFIELHGTLRNGLSSKMDREIDAVQNDLFYGGNVRSWQNGKVQVFLPSPDNDVFLVFVHFIRHFYKECMNLRQLCDWCRLLWTYRETLNYGLLESRIRRAGLIDEWKVFATFVVEYMGMPVEAMPLYESKGHKSEVRRKKKTERILEIILNSEGKSKVKVTYAIGKIFPWNTVRFLPSIFYHLNWMKVKERLFERRV